jgi:hypothetical protein
MAGKYSGDRAHAAMTTNLLALPLASMTIDTGTNEDWLDTLCYVVDDGTPNPPQLDLRGISFAMEVRSSPPDHEVIILATTDNGGLRIGPAPDYGWLIFYIPLDTMKVKFPGAYVGDIVASDGTLSRRVITFDLNIIEGVTR